MRIDITFHLDEHVTGKFDALVDYVNTLVTQGVHMAASIQQIRDKVTALHTEVTKVHDVASAVVTLLQGLNAQIASLAQQLQDALNANDPQAAQAALDELTAVNAEVAAERQRLADAVVAGTPAAGPNV